MATLEKTYLAVRDQLLPQDEASARDHEFILRNLGDRLSAGLPSLVILPEHPVWSVPVLFHRADNNLLAVGEVLVHGLTGEVMGSTTANEIHQRVRDTLEARVPPTDSVSRKRSIMELHRLGAEIWNGIDAQGYVNDLRKDWDHSS